MLFILTYLELRTKTDGKLILARQICVASRTYLRDNCKNWNGYLLVQ